MEPKANKWIIGYLQEDNIVFVRNTETLSWEETKELARQLVAEMRKYNSNRLLIEHFGEVKLSILQIDDLPGFIRGLDICDNDRVAICYERNSAFVSLLNFLKNVLIIKSHKLNLFTDKNQAIAWLKSRDERV
jgi:hypothetical protein